MARPDAIPLAAERLRAFLDAGAHGDMAWMETKAEWRGDPRALWPQARSIVMLGINYGPEFDPLAILKERTRGGISVYARGDDYHDVVKSRLKAVGRWLIDTAGGEIKVFVDTAPVMEKPLAAAAGIGWQGKHTNLVSRDFGSWLFLGAIFTTLDLPPDAPEGDHCGACHACLDVCPTAAFPAPYRLDARRCISYLTIEHKGPIDRALRPLMGNRIYGCDDCLAVCPWNKFAKSGREAKLAAREALHAPQLADAGAARRCSLPHAVCQESGQAHRARAIFAQCADRDRQFRRRRARARGRTACSMIPRRSFAAPPSGRSAGWRARDLLTARARAAP